MTATAPWRTRWAGCWSTSQTLVDGLDPTDQEELARPLTVFLRDPHDRADVPPGA